MRELGVGALMVRGENGTVQGTISRDMVVRRIAAGGDPRTVTVGEVASRRRWRSRAGGAVGTPAAGGIAQGEQGGGKNGGALFFGVDYDKLLRGCLVRSSPCAVRP